VAQVVETADRLDAGGDLCGSPVPAAEEAEVDPAAAPVREQDRVDRGRQSVERLNRLRLQRNRARAQPGLRVLEELPEALFRTRTGDPLLTMERRTQPVAIYGNGFGLFFPLPRLIDLPMIATSCNHGAP
jgi:hypothetical protein